MSFQSSSLQKLSTGSWKAGLLPLLKGAARCSASRLWRLLERVGDARLAHRHDAAAFPLELVEMLGLARRQHEERRRRARPAQRARQRQRAAAVFLVGDKRREGVPRRSARGRGLPRNVVPIQWPLRESGPDTAIPRRARGDAEKHLTGEKFQIWDWGPPCFKCTAEAAEPVAPSRRQMLSMIDHISIRVSDYERSKRFYRLALAPLGYKLMMEGASGAGFHSGPIPDFWISRGTPSPSVHVAFSCSDRGSVDAFHRAAIAAGGDRQRRAGSPPRFITRHITANSSSTPMATTSRRSAISPSDWWTRTADAIRGVSERELNAQITQSRRRNLTVEDEPVQNASAGDKNLDGKRNPLHLTSPSKPRSRSTRYSARRSAAA